MLEPLDATQLHRSLATMKSSGHSAADKEESGRNHLADVAAQAAALQKSKVTREGPCLPVKSESELATLEAQQLSVWGDLKSRVRRGCVHDSKRDLWLGPKGRLDLPELSMDSYPAYP